MSKYWQRITALVLAAVCSMGICITSECIKTAFKVQAKEEVRLFDDMNFQDIREDEWYYPYIKDLYDRGIMTGKTDTLFAPSEELVRAQFAAILYRMNGSPEVTEEISFPDVEPDKWYTDAIIWASSSGIIKGYSDTGRFGPSENLTREQMAVMMYRYAAYKEYDTGGKGMISVFPDYYYQNENGRDALKWAVGMGLITGDGGNLKSQYPVTRATCAAIIYRFLDKFEDNPVNYSAVRGVYRPIIEEYKDALENDFYKGDALKAPNVNMEFYHTGDRSAELLYSLVDIAGDGIPELLIAACREGAYFHTGYLIYDMYGYNNGTVHKLFDMHSIGGQFIFHICKDPVIRSYGNIDNYNQTYTFYKLDSKSVVPEEVQQLRYECLNGDKYYEVFTTGAETEITAQTWNVIWGQYLLKTDIAWYKLDDL